MKSDREKLPTRFLRRMTASYRRGRPSQSSVERPGLDEKDKPAIDEPTIDEPIIDEPSMITSRTQSDGQSPPMVPARTTSMPYHEGRPPTPPPKGQPSADRDPSRQAGAGPTPRVSSNRVSKDTPKDSDFEVIDAEDVANDTDSTISLDRRLSPLPPLPVFKGNLPPNRDDGVVLSEGDAKVKDPPNPKPGPSHIQTSHVIDIPVQKGPSSESKRGIRPRTGASRSREASNSRRRDERSSAKPAPSKPAPSKPARAKPASAPSSSKESPPTKAPSQNGPIFIPKIPPVSPTISPPGNLSTLAAGLEGNYVDEFGNVLDWHGHVLGRVEGDLPSMVGRPVSSTGEVLSPEGQVVGYVIENDTVKEPVDPKPLDGVAGPGLRVDHLGNILDSKGSIVGRMKNNNASGSEPAPKVATSSVPPPPQAPASENNEGSCSCGRTKPSAAPSPSEIYLDVKSTTDGIQLIIKIPTIFNKTPVVQIMNT